MPEHHRVHIRDKNRHSYVFRVVLEPDEDAWFVHVPALSKLGGATQGRTREEALARINEVIELILEELIEEGEPIPEDVHVSQDPLVAATI